MEIYKNKTWNKLCAPNWREDENILTCKAMGYFENSFYNNARYKVHNASNATFCSSLTTCINTTKDELQLCKGICHIKIVNCIIFPSFSAASRMLTSLCLWKSKYIHNFMHVDQYNDQGLSLQQSNQQRSISKKCSSCPKLMSISYSHHKNDKLLQVTTHNSKFTTHDYHQSGCGERV